MEVCGSCRHSGWALVVGNVVKVKNGGLKIRKARFEASTKESDRFDVKTHAVEDMGSM